MGDDQRKSLIYFMLVCVSGYCEKPYLFIVALTLYVLSRIQSND